jgi:hypothetical protein
MDAQRRAPSLKVFRNFADNHFVVELGSESLTTRHPVTFDRDAMTLTIDDRSTVVPDSAAGNEAMLRSYLALVAEVRGTPIGSGIEVRHDDVVVLAEILDLTDSDLEVHLANLLGVSANDAAAVHRRIRRHAAFAAAFAAALSSVAVVTTDVSAATNRPAAAVAFVREEVPTTIAFQASSPAAPNETPPAAANETPPPPPPPTTFVYPVSRDDVQIGDALVIEKGEQPDDPNTQIGDAVTYER